MNLVVRLPNWLGDTVMAVPTLRALRAGLPPETQIAVAGPWAALVAGQDLAEHCVTYPRAWAGRLRTADSVARLRPDTVLLLPNSLEAALAARYWGARRQIGYDCAGRGMLLTHPVPLPAPRLHQIDEYLVLLTPLGIAAITREPTLRPPSDDASATAVGELLSAGGATGRPLVGIHLGAAFGASKVWVADHLARFCDLLRGNGMTPVLLGTSEARALEGRVRAGAMSPPPSLVGRDRPGLLPALLARLDALVSGDTGTAHLAAALGTPTVTLFGPTDPTLTAPRGPATSIAKPVPCAPCFYTRCPIDHVCMRAITPEEVSAAVTTALSLPAKAHESP